MVILFAQKKKEIILLYSKSIEGLKNPRFLGSFFSS